MANLREKYDKRMKPEITRRDYWREYKRTKTKLAQQAGAPQPEFVLEVPDDVEYVTIWDLREEVYEPN